MLARLFFGFFLTFVVSPSAWGEVTSRDLRVTGDGLVTHDSETGLDWLDLTETTGLSWEFYKDGRYILASEGKRQLLRH